MDERAETMIRAVRARADRAVDDRDWIAAAALWLDVLRLGATDPLAPVRAGLSLRHAGRFAEADAVLREAAGRHPGEFAVALEYAWVAHSAAMWDEAELRWLALRTAHPDNPTSHICAALSLRQAGRRAQADAILLDAISRFPDNPDVAREYAWTAHWAGDLAAASARWADIQTRFPDRPEGFAFGAAAVRDAGDHAAARALLNLAQARFPDDPQIWVEALLIDYRERDFAAVLRACTALRNLAPRRFEGWRHGARALVELGRIDEGEALLAEGFELLPGHPDLLAEHALAAQARRDWPTARTRWQVLLQRHPGHAEARDAIGHLDLQAQLDRPDDTPRGRMNDDAELMLRFESLGDNCEFGLIQRRHGVEPLGLLRWASIQPSQLIRGLESDFADVVQPGVVSLTLDSNGEYIAHLGSLFQSHTFYREAQVDPETLLAQIIRRSEFLRRKLLHALTDGTRIFIIKCRGNRITRDEVDAVAAAIARHGPAHLLWVQVADAAHPPGSAIRLGRNLITGFVERLPAAPNTIETPHDTWLRVLRRAAEIVDEAAIAPQSPAGPASPPAPAGAAAPPPV